MPDINDLKSTPAGTLMIDWTPIENHLGFKLHENIKNFYSRILGGNSKWNTLEFRMKFNPLVFIKSYCNPKFEGWFADPESIEENSYTDVTLCTLKKLDEKYLCDFFEEGFHGEWTGGNDFGHRMHLGSFYLNVGDILLIFNNDTGNFEFDDCGYGYFEVYEDNPWGIVAESTEEFLNKFQSE